MASTIWLEGRVPAFRSNAFTPSHFINTSLFRIPINAKTSVKNNKFILQIEMVERRLTEHLHNSHNRAKQAFNSRSVSSTGLNAIEINGRTRTELKCWGAIDNMCRIIFNDWIRSLISTLSLSDFNNKSKLLQIVILNYQYYQAIAGFSFKNLGWEFFVTSFIIFILKTEVIFLGRP